MTLAETITPDDEGVAVMGEAIKGGAGEQVVVENAAPFGEGAIAGNNEGGVFVAFGDNFIQVLSGLRGERLQAEIIEDQQVNGEDFA